MDGYPSNSSPPKKLNGKVAIVTGGASGIGEETVIRLVDNGAYVVIADIQDEKGHALATGIGPDSCSYVRCDVTDEEQVKLLVDTTVELHGRLDIMFSNAGVMSSCNQHILDFDIVSCKRLFDVNVQGMVACVKHAARVMVASGVKGSIICTTSILATSGAPVQIDYCMSKHAVLGLVRSASKALGEYGIRVNCVSPGAVATPMVCGMFKMDQGEVEKHFAPTTFLKANGALKTRHVADGVVFLASDQSEFITGHNLVIDGLSRYSDVS